MVNGVIMPDNVELHVEIVARLVTHLGSVERNTANAGFFQATLWMIAQSGARTILVVMPGMVIGLWIVLKVAVFVGNEHIMHMAVMRQDVLAIVTFFTGDRTVIGNPAIESSADSHLAAILIVASVVRLDIMV